MKKVLNNITADALFDRFWSYYPRKVGKLMARRAFYKKDINTMQRIVDGLHNNQYEFSNDIQYIPHASTFLNQERYNDEPVMKTKKEDVYRYALDYRDDVSFATSVSEAYERSSGGVDYKRFVRDYRYIKSF